MDIKISQAINRLQKEIKVKRQELRKHSPNTWESWDLRGKIEDRQAAVKMLRKYLKEKEKK